MTVTELLVRKDHLATSRLRDSAPAALRDGEVRVAIDRFALTANNITYAAFGDAMGYWQFFPPAADEADIGGWGCIPVWGFGSVVQSLHPGVAAGERLYGYWPMASQAVLRPGRLSAEGFGDAAPRRAALHPVYNRYLRCASDPFYTAATEDLQALLRPLFMTAWLIDDFLADNAFFGAAAADSAAAGSGGEAAPPVQLVLSSASSKTAYSTAALLARRTGVDVVGLSSTGNLDFCRSLGCYHRVLAYDQIDQLDADAPSVYVDFAGNAALRLALHQRLRRLAYSCSVGGTHVEQLGAARGLPGPRATLFFAPAQVAKRGADWGPDELQRRVLQSWREFLGHATDASPPWLVVRQHRGPEAVQEAYRQLLAGASDPRSGHMLWLRPSP